MYRGSDSARAPAASRLALRVPSAFVVLLVCPVAGYRGITLPVRMQAGPCAWRRLSCALQHSGGTALRASRSGAIVQCHLYNSISTCSHQTSYTNASSKQNLPLNNSRRSHRSTWSAIGARLNQPVRLCSSEASSLLAKMAKDRDVLSDEYGYNTLMENTSI